jgi:hypothetical protein
MRFKKFVIRNYRAVSYAEVPVGHALIPLIGVNESGKTSILQAILAFDRVSDAVNGRRHLQFKNKYQLGEQDCTVSAEILIDQESDLAAIAKQLRLDRGSDLLDELERAYREKQPLTVVRDLKSRDYSVQGWEADAKTNRRLAKALYKLLPLVLYFDDFTDRVPESVRFAAAESEKGYSLKKNRQAVWQRIVEEVFRRASDHQYTLSDFIKMNDRDERDSLLSDIQDELNKEVMEDWRRLRTWSGALADEPGDLFLELRYHVMGKLGFRFEFKVQDRTIARGRFFNVVDRSKGFQWFFNFLMKLKFNPKYQNQQSGAIYLLDEPGSYLHSSAQEELLKELKGISETNTIIYCTHSQHLLDPDIINIAQTKIVSKDKGEIAVVPFGSATTSNYQGALTPLYNALQLRSGVFNRRLSKAVICEGITDYYFFSMLTRHSRKHRIPNLDFIPGGGAGHLKDLISMAIAWADDYLVLLDSDSAGTRAKRAYAKFFGSHEGDRILTYATPQQSDDVTLEDFLSQDDQQRLLDTTGASHVKAAIATLYYSDQQYQESLFQSLDSATLDNLTLITERLKQLSRR